MRLLLLSLLLILLGTAPAFAQDSYLDTDGDGYFDPVPAEQIDECPDEPGPNQGCPPPDTDGDGFTDDVDNCVDVSNQSQIDTDSDGEGNACDSDDDGDGRTDADDYDPLDANVQDPPAPPGEVLWTGDGENATNQDWTDIHTKKPYCGVTPQSGIAPNNHGGYHSRVTSNPAPMQGAYAYRVKVDDSYDCFQERTELSQLGSNNPKQFNPGDENYEAFGIYLLADYNSADGCSGARTSFQHKPVPSDNPTTSLKACNNTWQWTTQGGSPTNPDKHTDTIGPVTEGTWCRFLLHTKYTTSAASGLTEVWSDIDNGCNGTLTLQGSRAKPTLYNNSTAIRVNMGLYREASDSGTETLSNDGYAVGTTPEIVTEHAFGTPFTP